MTIPQQALFNLSDEMIGIFDLNWQPLELNQAWTQVLGWSHDELLKKNFKDLIHPQDLEIAKSKVSEEISRGINKGIVYRNLCKNGQYRYISWNVQFDLEQNFVYALAKDVTQQIVYDELSKQARKIAGIGTWVIDVAENKIYLSPELYELVGLPLQTAPEELNKGYQIFTAPTEQLLLAQYQNLIRLGQDFDIEVPAKSLAKRHFKMRIVGSCLKQDNIVIKAFGICQDISKTKEAEWKLNYQQNILKGLLEASPSVLYVKDTRGQFVIASRQFEKILGKSKEHIVGKTDFEIFQEQDAIQNVQNDSKIRALQKTIVFEEDITFPDGSSHHFLSEKFPIISELDGSVHVGGVSTDITDIYRYQKELVQAKEFAESLTQAKSNFLANMSHEIR